MVTKTTSVTTPAALPKIPTKEDDKVSDAFRAATRLSRAERRKQNKSKYVYGADPLLVYEKAHEVFKAQFPFHVHVVLKSYIVGDREATFVKRFDLSDMQALQKYLSGVCQTADHLRILQTVIARVYEVQERDVIGDKMGALAFPVFSEVLIYAMRLLQSRAGQSVLEIGAASGEISAILAFSNAARLYVNDINIQEMQQFEKLKKALPDNVQGKLLALNRSCFDLPKKHPHLTNALDLVIARNVLHCFDSAQQKEFFWLMRRLLKTGGRGIITANCIHFQANSAQMLASAPRAVSFTKTVCRVLDFHEVVGDMLFSALSQPSQIVTAPTFKSADLHACNRGTNFTWKRFESSFELLDSDTRKKIEAIIERRPDIFDLDHACININIHELQYYSEHTIVRLVEGHGFEVEEIFLNDTRGHLILEGADKQYAQEIGVIFTKKY